MGGLQVLKKTFTIGLFVVLFIVLFVVTNNMLISTHLDEKWFGRLGAISTTWASIFAFVAIYFAYKSLDISRKMISEMRNQNAPAVTVKIKPDKTDFNLLNLSIKNTGGSPAYDIHIEFEPDLPYSYSGAKTVNELTTLKLMPLLEKGEEIEFFFASAIDYFDAGSQNIIEESTVSIIYYDESSIDNNKRSHICRKYRINLLESKNQLYASRRNLHDLTNEIEELKQGILILLKELGEKETNGTKTKLIKRIWRSKSKITKHTRGMQSNITRRF